MKVIFVGAYYYGGPVHHLFRIFQIYKAMGDVFEKVGIDVRYFVKHNEIIPLHKTIDEKFLMDEIATSNLLFIWNGAQSRHIIDKCAELSIPIYFSELGWLPQNGTFYFDRKGVNYASTLTDWAYAPITPEQKRELDIKLAYYHRCVCKKTGINESDYIFVPLQVENDSQIILCSPRIKKMQQLIDYACSFIPDKIIFKMHPKDNIQNLNVPARCKLYKTGTTHDFLPNCKYVVTINSTVGLEALTYYKPVITLGSAFYGARKMTYEVHNDNEFRNAIAWAGQGKVATGAIDAFLYYIFQRQWYTAHLSDANKIFSLLEGLTDLS